MGGETDDWEIVGSEVPEICFREKEKAKQRPVEAEEPVAAAAETAPEVDYDSDEDNDCDNDEDGDDDDADETPPRAPTEDAPPLLSLSSTPFLSGLSMFVLMGLLLTQLAGPFGGGDGLCGGGGRHRHHKRLKHTVSNLERRVEHLEREVRGQCLREEAKAKTRWP